MEHWAKMGYPWASVQLLPQADALMSSKKGREMRLRHCGN